MIRFFCLLPALFLCACQSPALLSAVTLNPARDTEIARDIAYGDGPRQQLDFYIPDGPGPHPVLIFVHGGGWHAGNKDGYGFAGKRFAADGYLTAVISYRLVPEGAYPGFMEDTAKAVAWVHANAAAYGGDPDRLYLTGHSAGAYNVVQVALAEEFLAAEGTSPAIIDGVAGIAGPYDFLPLDPGAAMDAFGGADDLPATQPVNRVTAQAPPMLLLTGDEDKSVRPRNVTLLADKLSEVGVQGETRIYPGIGHIGIIMALAFPSRAPTARDIDEFFTSVGDRDQPIMTTEQP